MVISLIQLAAVLLVPLAILKYRNNRLTRLFGTIGMAYFYGLLVSAAVWAVNACGVPFSLNSDIGEIGSYAAIGVAIPLLLFSTDLREVGRLTKTVLLSFGSLTAARRGGTTIALTVLNQYALVGEQPIIPSCYWCMAHGSTPEEVRADAEGMCIAYTLGKRMAEYTQRLC